MSKKAGGRKKKCHQYGYWNQRRIARRPWAWEKKLESEGRSAAGLPERSRSG